MSVVIVMTILGCFLCALHCFCWLFLLLILHLQLLAGKNFWPCDLQGRSLPVMYVFKKRLCINYCVAIDICLIFLISRVAWGGRYLLVIITSLSSVLKVQMLFPSYPVLIKGQTCLSPLIELESIWDHALTSWGMGCASLVALQPQRVCTLTILGSTNSHWTIFAGSFSPLLVWCNWMHVMVSFWTVIKF